MKLQRLDVDLPWDAARSHLLKAVRPPTNAGGPTLTKIGKMAG
ncbi:MULTISPECIES: hypothetical protein [Cyanophyceae]|nr:hypothetical protein [Nodosilinea sp. FACHB-131]